MSLNCLEQCLTLNCFLKGSYNMLEKAWNQNPSKKPVRRDSVSRTLAVRSSIQTGTSRVVISPAGLQMFTECSSLSRATVEGSGGSLWAIKTCLLARRGDVSDEGLWGSQVGHWHLRMEGWTFSMTRGLHCGKEPHPVREGTSLPTQLTSPENPFMISFKSIYLGWEVTGQLKGKEHRWKREVEEETCGKHGLRQVFFCPTF